MTQWILLYVAIAFEVAGTTALKLAADTKNNLWFVVSLTLYGVGFFLLTRALVNIPIGVVYAIWSGLGTVLVVIIGILWFGESLTALKAAFMLMIVVGAVGLNLIGAK